ncbi:30S ribosomal protein S15 [Candidatus Babeliales bacterium]|nr:30S ribosomal protein S15 [Candidatus Babeliales bacterium]MBP9843631.1 30S ribosomal protein S15 [Candidatus Babeliales bacterium]
MLTPAERKAIIDQFKISDNDTGSSAVQVALLTAEINALQVHCKENHKDYSSRRGLLQKVSYRKLHLKYLQNTNKESYQDLLKRLNLRK